MKRRSFVQTAVAAVAALALSGLCACASTETDTTATPETPTTTQEETATTKTVVDAYGRTILVPAEVTKVATVGSGARIVVYAGAVEKLVAVTDMETGAAPTRPYTIAYQDFFASLPSTSNGNHLNETEVDAEAMLALAPDVIISSRSAEECDALQAKIGIPVVGVSYQDDLFGSKIKTSITCVAQACGTEEAAQELLDAIAGWEKDITERLTKVTSESPKVYAAGLNFKGSKGFTGTSASYPVFEILGLTNVAADSGNTSNFDTTIEQIGAWDPEYIFANMANLSKLQADYEANAAFFDMMTAFKEDKIYSQPSFTYNGTNTELAICDVYWTASVIYPEAFGDCASAEFLGSIVEAFLHTPTLEQLNQMGINFNHVDEWSK